MTSDAEAGTAEQSMHHTKRQVYRAHVTSEQDIHKTRAKFLVAPGQRSRAPHRQG